MISPDPPTTDVTPSPVGPTCDPLTTASKSLRLRAEQVFGEKSGLSPDAVLEMTHEDAQLLFHELRVHQIELEMQNEHLRQSHMALDAAAAQYADLYDHAPVGYITVGTNGLILQANFLAAALLGLKRGDLLNRPVSSLIHRDDQDRYYLLRKQVVVAHEPVTLELSLLRSDGSAFWASLTVTAVPDALDGPALRIVLADMTERRAAEEKIRHLAFYDPLTGLPNRRLLLDRVEKALATSFRHRKEGALLFVDLDKFKQVNDTLGHDMGDLLLQQVAQRLLTCIRDGDTAARLGGDEFIVMLEDLSEKASEAATEAQAVAEKMLQSLNEPYQLARHSYRGTLSIGITLFLDHEKTVEELLKQADMAMFQAKAEGRNTLRFFDPVMQAKVSARVWLEKELTTALQENQFVLHFQPQVNQAHELTGAEVLVYWQHPQRGLLPPLEFIAFTEETGQILPLGRWVLEAACQQLVLWACQPDTAHWVLAVNVSARQFHQPDFVAQIRDILARTGANPQRLKLELTESMLVSNVEDIIEKMEALKADGLSFSLDDFGTGYSSLAYLNHLPLDQLKIDQSFVTHLLTDTHQSAICRAIVAMGHSMGLQVIAEGVETLAQCDFLARLGCDAYQGYYFGAPVSMPDFQAKFMIKSGCSPL